MDGNLILDIARDGIVTFLKVAGWMVIALAVGLVVSLIQALDADPGADPHLRAEDPRGVHRHADPVPLHGRCDGRLHDAHRGAHRERRVRARLLLTAGGSRTPSAGAEKASAP